MSPALSRDQLVASSSAWLAVSLNLGCQGVGYIYQRRWGAFWVGGAAAIASAIVLGAGSAALINTGLSLVSPAEMQKDRDELVLPMAMLGGYAGLLAVGIGSAVEAGLAVRRAQRRLGR